MAGSMVGDKDMGQLVTNRGGHSAAIDFSAPTPKPNGRRRR
jgi:hypothetical protein